MNRNRTAESEWFIGPLEIHRPIPTVLLSCLWRCMLYSYNLAACYNTCLYNRIHFYLFFLPYPFLREWGLLWHAALTSIALMPMIIFDRIRRSDYWWILTYEFSCGNYRVQGMTCEARQELCHFSYHIHYWPRTYQYEITWALRNKRWAVCALQVTRMAPKQYNITHLCVVQFKATNISTWIDPW